MSNSSVLLQLLSELSEYNESRKDRDLFAKRFSESIEALEGIPYSIITQARDWEYKIEMEGFYDDDNFESDLDQVIPKLQKWVNELLNTYS